jgi:hypothetical protein
MGLHARGRVQDIRKFAVGEPLQSSSDQGMYFDYGRKSSLPKTLRLVKGNLPCPNGGETGAEVSAMTPG